LEGGIIHRVVFIPSAFANDIDVTEEATSRGLRSPCGAMQRSAIQRLLCNQGAPSGVGDGARKFKSRQRASELNEWWFLVDFSLRHFFLTGLLGA
jgi:hypothetical protein